MRTVSADELARLRADPRLAVGDDAIVCLACGRAFRQLTNTHLATHGLDAAAYKARYGYNAGRPLMCTALAAFYSDRAKTKRLADRIRSRPLALMPDLRRLGGRREIRHEERLARRAAMRAAARVREVRYAMTGGRPPVVDLDLAEVFHWRRLGRSFEWIADVLGVSAATIRARVRQAGFADPGAKGSP